MEPLSAEEKEKHELDTDADLFWRKDGNIADAKGWVVKRLDMTSEKSKEIRNKGQKRKMREAQDQVKELIEQESPFKFEEAPYALVLAAERAITGSSADMRLFLEQARGVGKLADKSKDAAPQKIIVDMDKSVREAMIRAIEIVERGKQRRSLGEAAPDRPF
jgi:hypothetical protein